MGSTKIGTLIRSVQKQCKVKIRIQPIEEDMKNDKYLCVMLLWIIIGLSPTIPIF